MQNSPVFFLRFSLALALGFLLQGLPAHAANVTWTGANGADWNTSGNPPWSNGSKPTSADAAVFTGTVSGTNVANLVADQSINSITFSGTAGSYTIGSTSGNKLLLTSGGLINIATLGLVTGGTATVNAPLVIGSGSAAATYAFSNQTGIGPLAIGGAVSAGTTGATTLTLGGAGSASIPNTVSGLISNGSSSALGISKTGSTTWYLTNSSNSFTGGVSFTSGAGDINFVSGALGTIGNISYLAGTSALIWATGNTEDISGRLKNSAVAMTINTNGNDVVFASAIDNSNTGGLIKTGSGALTLSGSNSYGGSTSLSFGVLRLDNASNGGLGAGNLSLNSGNLQAVNAARTISNNTTLDSNSTISGTHSLTINGTFTNNGASRTLTNTVSSGSLTLSSVFLSGTSATGRVLTIAGTGNTRIDAIADSSTGTSATATSGLTLNSTGTLTLANANTYTGTTTLTSGAVVAGDKAVFGASALLLNGASVSSLSASADLSGENAIGNAYGTSLSGSNFTFFGSNNLELSGVSTSNVTHTFTNNIAGGTLILSGNTHLSNSASNFTLTMAGSGNTVISGVIDNGFGGSTASNLTFGGSGRLQVTGANTYGGVTTLAANSGTMTVTNMADGGAASSVGQSSAAASNLVLGNASTLQYTGTGGSSNRLFTISASSGAGQSATLDASGSGALNLTGTGAVAYGTNAQTRGLVLTGTNTQNNTLAALIGNNGSGVVSVTKNGSGKWTLTGSNTYTGTTTVNAGTLIINGNQGSSAVVVNGGALGGSGTVGALSIKTGGTLAPGNSAGILNSGTFNLEGGGTLAMELTGNTVTPIAGTNYDQVNVTGSVTLGGDLNLSLSLYTHVPDSVVFLVNNDGSDLVSGVFANANFDANTIFTLGGLEWRINYNANSATTNAGNFGSALGNDIALLAVPEPGTVGMVGLGLVIGLYGFARRRSRN